MSEIMQVFSCRGCLLSFGNGGVKFEVTCLIDQTISMRSWAYMWMSTLFYSWRRHFVDWGPSSEHNTHERRVPVGRRWLLHRLSPRTTKPTNGSRSHQVYINNTQTTTTLTAKLQAFFPNWMNLLPTDRWQMIECTLLSIHNNTFKSHKTVQCNG